MYLLYFSRIFASVGEGGGEINVDQSCKLPRYAMKIFACRWRGWGCTRFCHTRDISGLLRLFLEILNELKTTILLSVQAVEIIQKYLSGISCIVTQ